MEWAEGLVPSSEMSRRQRCMRGALWRDVFIPLMEERLGSMVMAPTATSSRWWMGLLLAPQLSDPIHRKWPT